MKMKKRNERADNNGTARWLDIGGILVDIRKGLRELMVRVGLAAVMELLEAERTTLCGPRSKLQQERKASRYGYDTGKLVVGGRKISVRKPRVRSSGGKEIPLPAWQELSDEDPLRSRVMEQILVGVSTRNYARSLEPLAEEPGESVSRSSVSRHFAVATERKLAEFLSCSLEGVDFPALMVDGTRMGEHVLVVMLGIDATGRKHVLGLREGSTENEEVCKSLFSDCIARGLKLERARLFVIDGGKGLRKAIRSVFGNWALIQRCRIHKMRNVLEHLPQSKRSWVKAAIAKAWSADNVAAARRQLKSLAHQLKGMHPGAAASLEEGLEETLTIISLGISGTLADSLCSTNPIENLNGSMKKIARNVKRWRGGSMALRWASTILLEAQKNFRRLRGCRQMPELLAALDKVAASPSIDPRKKAA
jgi:transposase-like protein